MLLDIVIVTIGASLGLAALVAILLVPAAVQNLMEKRRNRR